MANPAPQTEQLTPFGSGKLSPEEEYKIKAAGGRAAAAVVKQKRYSEKVRERFQELLSMPCGKGRLEKVKNFEDISKNISVEDRIFMKLISDYLETGNLKILALIMRYSGGDEGSPSPTELQEEQEQTLVEALNKQAEEVWKDETKTE